MSESSGLLYDPFAQQRQARIKRRSRGYFIKLGSAIVGLLLLISLSTFKLMKTEHHTNKYTTEKLSFKIYNQNIRFDSSNLFPDEEPWGERKFELYRSIKFNSFNTKTIITLQEVLKNQLDDILELLNQDQEADWSYVGVGRTDGKEEGEFSPVLYDRSQFKLLESQTFWLSETPDVPSKGWDAVLERIVIWARFESIGSTKKSFNVFNTHLDHIGVKAREESVKLISRKTATHNKELSFITGDFNSEPHEEAYQTLSAIFKDSRLFNSNKYGYDLTYTGFDLKERDGKIIDYVFIDPRLEEAQGFGVLGNYYDSLFSSDHRPVVVELSI